MQKSLSYIICLAAAVVISGCTSAPKPEPQAQRPLPRPLLNELLEMSGGILDVGGVAAVGIAESKSLDLALQRAAVNGRLELAQALKAKVEALQNSFVEEAGLTGDLLTIIQFHDIVTAITQQQIQDVSVSELKHETIDDTATAYALVELDPQVILNQLQQAEELYTRFRSTETFKAFTREIENYSTYKQVPAAAPAEQ